MIRVLVVDDHPVVATGLATLLGEEADLTVAGVAGGGAEGVSLAADLCPDIVLMDLSMPEVDGVEATVRLSTEVPEARVLILTSYADEDRVIAALDAGAVGFLLKDSPPADLVKAVREAHRGEVPLHPRAARAVLNARTPRPPVELTRREQEVLGLVGAGLGNKQIARRLGIAEKTVKTHLTSIFSRIGVSDRTQAALWHQRHASSGSESR